MLWGEGVVRGSSENAYENVVALADEYGYRVVNYEYDARGLLTNTPESVTTGNGEYLRNANPFRYSSYQFDPEIGLYYLKARYYTANLGRFLTRDKLIGIDNKVSGLNLYIYCKNNPVNMVDPNGLFSVAIASFAARYGMGLSGAALAVRLTTFVLAIAPYLIWGVVAIVAAAVIAYGAYVIAQKVTIYNIIKKIPSKLKSGDKVNLSKFTGKGPKQPKGGRSLIGPLGWYILKDLDQHKGSVWKLFNWAGQRIASLAADGRIVGK